MPRQRGLAPHRVHVHRGSPRGRHGVRREAFAAVHRQVTRSSPREGTMMDIPLIEQIRIQARVLVPLVKALQAELGEARANALDREALGAQYRELGERWWRQQGAANLGDKLAASFET